MYPSRWWLSLHHFANALHGEGNVLITRDLSRWANNHIATQQEPKCPFSARFAATNLTQFVHSIHCPVETEIVTVQSCLASVRLFSSQVIHIYEWNNEVVSLSITLQILAVNHLYIKPYMWKKEKNPTKSKISTPRTRSEQTQIQRKHLLRSIKKILHHSLCKVSLPPKSSSLGKPAWPELHYTLHPSAFPAASLGQAGERERKGLWKKLSLTSRSRNYPVLDVLAHIMHAYTQYMYKYLFYPNRVE